MVDLFIIVCLYYAVGENRVWAAALMRGRLVVNLNMLATIYKARCLYSGRYHRLKRQDLLLLSSLLLDVFTSTVCHLV